MNTELNNRFFQKKVKELLTDSTKPFPTMICERESPEVTELVRQFCLFSPHMKSFNRGIELPVSETLETEKVVSYGDMYILVNYN
jgi:hypothetical protein